MGWQQIIDDGRIKLLGDSSEGVPPVPIPNTEAPLSAPRVVEISKKGRVEAQTQSSCGTELNKTDALGRAKTRADLEEPGWHRMLKVPVDAHGAAPGMRNIM